ncbi:hypothetical protein [Paenarthrobacter sp. YJN-5]|uniref:hypothetical protein n=1 Tax=Paenarthrobacter sp. YJN-5 TaxID=2735316 RepID=UPI001878A92F|nr:hypothetical protein [Paenarthrobacter sp. YJN-5]QOT19732.1 hypothetical protein HMI59_24025 [Paenarthrobacter sp. YJN-5]
MTAKIKFNNKAFTELLKGDATRTDLFARAKRIAEAANANDSRGGEGFAPSVRTGSTRVRSSVITTNWEARVAEAKHLALTRAIDAGRGGVSRGGTNEVEYVDYTNKAGKTTRITAKQAANYRRRSGG